MDDDFLVVQPGAPEPNAPVETSTTVDEEIKRLQGEFEARLIAADLRTEAVRAGMIDLDGLKLLDLKDARLDEHDRVVGGRKIMTELRRSKPWLFGGTSSSSGATAPTSQPVRLKTAMNMTDEEYAVARSSVTKYKI